MPDYVMEDQQSVEQAPLAQQSDEQAPLARRPPEEAADRVETNAPEPEPSPTAETKAEEEQEELPDLPEDLLEALAEAYADKLTEHPRIKERLDRELQQRIEEQEREYRLLQEKQLRTQTALEQGKQAAQRISQTLTTYRDMLQKIKKADVDPEELDLSSLPSVEELSNALASFGTAVYMDAASTYDSAFSTAFAELGKDLIRDEDVPKVQQIARVVQQMEQDPNYALQAKAYLFTETLRLLLERAMEKGREEGRQEAVRKRDAIAKVTQANALNAALARLASKKMPPNPSPTVPANAPTVDYMKEYEEAKRSGNVARAEEILSMWAQARARGES